MIWFKKKKLTQNGDEKRSVKVPQGLWVKCDNCAEIIYKQEVERNHEVCPKCNYHFRINAAARIELLFDKGSFVEMDAGVESKDPLEFKDLKKYSERLKTTMEKSPSKDAFISGEGRLCGLKVLLGVFEFAFMGGSMGSVVGEKITRLVERATAEGAPLIIVASSGGARMQEGMFSLMQMAKTSAALARLRERGAPYVSILTDPTTGGVTASFAMLGDVIMAEPRALICFAGPRVIEQTIRQKLPEGFQRSEYLLEHGMVDMIVERRDMKETLYKVISNLASS